MLPMLGGCTISLPRGSQALYITMQLQKLRCDVAYLCALPIIIHVTGYLAIGGSKLTLRPVTRSATFACRWVRRMQGRARSSMPCGALLAIGSPRRS